MKKDRQRLGNRKEKFKKKFFQYWPTISKKITEIDSVFLKEGIKFD